MSIYEKISIIGAGRLGLSLALKILKSPKGTFKLEAISSRSMKSLDIAKDTLGSAAKKVFFTSNNAEASKISDIILICTPDDKISTACAEISKDFKKTCFGSKEPKNKTVIHFSGSKMLNELYSAKKANISIACMHPIKSFADPKEAYKTIKGTLFGVTYDKKDEKTAGTIGRLLEEFEGRSIFIENDKKALYHASACIASNYLVSLLDYTAVIAHKIGVCPDIFLDGLLYLSEGTIKNIRKMGTRKALTGPIARGDVTTIKEHVEKIKKTLKPDILEMYALLGSKTAEISYENKWINEHVYKDFIKIFKEGT